MPLVRTGRSFHLEELSSFPAAIGFIPGVRPGSETKEYLSNVLNRITVLGAILLTFIAVLPYAIAMLTGLPSQAAVGGTGIIIVVGVAMETTKTLKGQLTQKQYHGFVGK